MKRIAVTIGIAFLVGGCASTSQPAFDPNKKEVKIVDGKHYKVPVGASLGTQPITDAKVIKFYHDIGLADCKKGDVTWETQETADAVNVIMRSGSKDGGKEIYRKAATEDKVGCVSPISDEELMRSIDKAKKLTPKQ